MKKLNLRFLSSMLSAVMLLSAVNVCASGSVYGGTKNNSNKKSMPLGGKVALVGGGLAIGAGALIYALTRRPSDTIESISVSAPKLVERQRTNNANFTNTKNLCYWHSFVQQMYSLNSFRNFIDRVDLKGLKPEVAEKIRAFRVMFRNMSFDNTVPLSVSEAFAGIILPQVGRQQDIHEVWTNFMSDISDKYTQYCRGNANIFGQPIRLEHEPLNLRSLLTGEPNIADKRGVIPNLLSDPEKLEALRERAENISLRDYMYKDPDTGQNVVDYQGINVLFSANPSSDGIPDKFKNKIVTDFSDVPCVREALQSLPAPEFDIPVIDNQFAVFVARFDARRNKDRRRIDFGDGMVTFHNQIFELTAVSVHKGNTGGGHYYTYKKHGNDWYKYDDYSGVVPRVTWEKVKNDSEKDCTMLTFSLVQSRA